MRDSLAPTRPRAQLIQHGQQPAPGIRELVRHRYGRPDVYLVEQEWVAAHPDSTVTRRDLAVEPVPATAWADAVTASFVGEGERTDRQREAQGSLPRFSEHLS